MDKVYDVKMELERDSLFDEHGIVRLQESYLAKGETSPQERFAYVSKMFATDEAHAQRLYEYASKHWLSYSTPVLSYGRSKNALPISCYLSYLDDSAEGLVETLSEVCRLSMSGGGVGIHFKIRSQDHKSVGVIPHVKTYDAAQMAYCQGTTRRGSFAAYLDVSHPDIVNFIELRKGTGDQNLRAQNLHNAVNLTDEFMQKVEGAMLDPEFDDSWPLVDPHSGKVTEVVSAKYLWQKLLEVRVEKGEPYLFFIDTANRALPSWLKDKGIQVYGSNLCAEISLPTSKERTAVCCLSSLNLEYYDDWKDHPEFVGDVLEMLDNVITVFIKEAPPELRRAVLSATRERSVGLGSLGWHSLLQKKMIPFESAAARSLNKKIYKSIKEKCAERDYKLALERGSCPDAEASGVVRRMSHWTAIAPNASSSIIMGNTSPSIEPYCANLFQQQTMSGTFILRNRHLEKALEAVGMNTDEVWAQIRSDEGSVQKIEGIPDEIKEVFKTAVEIDQMALVQLAADRAPYIDQSQSLNLFLKPNCHIKYLHAVHFAAWKLGVKSLYYLRSEKIASADKVGQKVQKRARKKKQQEEPEVDLAKLAGGDVCVACEG